MVSLSLPPQSYGTSRKGFSLELAVIFIYLLLSPFYLVNSGLPQASGIFIAVGMAICFTGILFRAQSLKMPQVYVLAGLFSIYTFIINLIYFFFLQDFIFMLSSLYYVFNVLVFIFISHAFRQDGERAAKSVYAGIAVIILLQVGLVGYDPVSWGHRAVGTFNNPNQLAY
jgi:uncharacterized membrane protein YccC